MRPRSRGRDDAPRGAGIGRHEPRQRLLWSPVALLLVLLMAAGSILMWIGLPLGLIWIASAISESSQPSMGPYLLILVGLPIGAIVIGKALGALDRMHGRVTGRTRRRAEAQHVDELDGREGAAPTAGSARCSTR